MKSLNNDSTFLNLDISDEEPFLLCNPEPEEVSKDPCDDCPGCILKCRFEPLVDEQDVFDLLKFMTDDIKNLEAEIVRWRQVLLKYLDPDKADGLFDDIFSNLHAPISLYDFDTYQQFMDYCYNGEDPLDDPEHVEKMLRLRDGTDETSIHYL